MGDKEFRLDRETRQFLTRTIISVAGSTVAAILGALAFRYIVVDRVMEDPSLTSSKYNDDDSSSASDDGQYASSAPLPSPGSPNYRKERLKSLNLNKYEAMLATDVIFPDDVDSSLEDIGGLQSTITIIKERVLFPLTHQYLYAHSRILQRPTGILLYGPPGTGKTLLAKAIAKTSQASFLSINVGNLQNKWYGETPKLITALFTLAKKLSPCILFMDEADGFLGSRGNGNELSNSQADVTAKTQFLQHWEGLTANHHHHHHHHRTNTSSGPSAKGTVASSPSPSQWILLIGATNRPEALDPAVLRRMPCQIHIGLPTLVNRIDILKVLLRYENCAIDNLDLTAIGKLTKGFSGSDLKEVVREAAMVPVRETLEQYNVYDNSSLLTNPLIDSPLQSNVDKGKTRKTSPQPASLRSLRTDDLVYGVNVIRPSVLTAVYSTEKDDTEEPNENDDGKGTNISHPGSVSVPSSSESLPSTHNLSRSRYLTHLNQGTNGNQENDNHNDTVPCAQCLQSLLHLSHHQHSRK